MRRIKEPRTFIQVLVGPRQTGKTTLARQLAAALDVPCHYASADEPALKSQHWIDQQWEAARLSLKAPGAGHQAVLMLDQLGHRQRDAVLRETAGIWKDRKHLPDFEAARADWDRQQSQRTQSFSTQMFL